MEAQTQATTIYDVTRDPQGISVALAELLEESFCRSRVACDFADEGTAQRIDSSMPQRTLSPGYYKVASFLFWLEERVKARTITAGFLAFEMEGVAQVTAARGEFATKHPKCNACGAAQDSRFAAECHACHAKFTRSN
jgi:hypothetical protein